MIYQALLTILCFTGQFSILIAMAQEPIVAMICKSQKLNKRVPLLRVPPIHENIDIIGKH